MAFGQDKQVNVMTFIEKIIHESEVYSIIVTKGFF